MKTGKNFLLLISLALSALLLTACGGSSSSSSSTQANVAAAAKAYPTDLNARAGDAQVNLNWIAAIGASTYTVYYATTDLTASTNATILQSVTGISSMTVSATSATITGLSNGTAYYFKVTAHTATGESQPSDQATATPFVPAPTNLVATAGENQVTLSWTDVSDATYKVYYFNADLTNSTNATILQSVTGISSMTVSATSATITGLSNSTAYYFKVTAHTATGESQPSDQATATPFVPAPTNLVATAGENQVTLSWTDVSDATYKVYYFNADLTNSTNATALQSVAGISSMTVSTTSTDITGLTAGTKYYFSVTALKAGVQSLPSNVASATPVPAAPAGFSAAAGNGQATLAWDTVTSASYKVYYGTSGSYAGLEVINFPANGSVDTVGSTTLSVVTHTISSLSNGIKYYFVVTVVQGGVESAASTELTATPPYTDLGNTLASARTGNISSAGQIDWYQFTASTTGNYVALATADSTTVIGIYNTTQNTSLCAATNPADKKNAYVEYATTANETYYLCVTASGSTTGSYNLKVMGSVISSTNSSFIYYQNDVVLEKGTNLFWQRTDGGTSNWTTAVSYCAALTLAGYDNWSLPTQDELTTIAQRDGTLKGSFTNNPSDYWSSTENPYIQDAMRVNFYDDNQQFWFPKSGQYYARCVIR